MPEMRAAGLAPFRKIVFGQYQLCPRCLVRKSRRRAYSTGRINVTRGEALAAGYTIIRSYGEGFYNVVVVRCPVCEGRKIVKIGA